MDPLTALLWILAAIALAVVILAIAMVAIVVLAVIVCLHGFGRDDGRPPV